MKKSAPARSAGIVAAICGCKWSLTVFQLIRADIIRPGEMVRSVEGLSTKVLNDCLRRNVEFGIVERTSYPELPPRVEYKLTAFGHRFVQILDQLEALQDEIDAK